MKQVILGTAGHIDHGKTALVKALTGIDTDRLKEEKERGITIELGFAYLLLPDGSLIGIVDVPGHEKFVRTMVAGATGIDIVLLVIAADEGVMPQTREHLDICRLLGIKRGLIALTKIDLVDEEFIELVEEDICTFVKGTFLEGAPILRVSSVTGQGIPELMSAITEIVRDVEGKSPEGRFRLPIDRVFTMKGFGTIVTGTLVTGTMKVGDQVRILPSDIRSRVRGIEVHNRAVEQSRAGQRTAVNLQGVEKESIERGDWLVHPDIKESTLMVDAIMEYLPGQRPLKNRSRVRFHIGTSEIFGNIILLDRDEIKGGERANVQIRLEKPTVAFYGDRYVLRSYSPVHTIGGGMIIDSHPKKHRRFSEEVTIRLRDLSTGNVERIIEIYIQETGFSGISFKGLMNRIILSEMELRKIIQTLEKERVVVIEDGEPIFIHRGNYERLCQICIGLLHQFHKEHPIEAGLPKEEFRTKLPSSVNQKVFNYILRDLIQRDLIFLDGDRVRLSSHEIRLGKVGEELVERIEGIFSHAGLEPPGLGDLERIIEIGREELRKYIELLCRKERLVKVKEGLYFHTSAVSSLKDRLVKFLNEKGEISPSEFKEMTRVSRKYMIPLLEFFDERRITVRVGDKRRLRQAVQ
jgi:selenocysteine-specific elongation factor